MKNTIYATLSRCEELIQVNEPRAAAELAISRLHDLLEWLEEVPEPETPPE